MSIVNDPRVRATVNEHPHDILFASLSGAHLYGFESVDSDVDIRGAHVLPVEDFLRLSEPADTHEMMDVVDGLEIDVVTYDIKKFCSLVIRRNGNVLEQVVSPLVVATSDAHKELRRLVERCVCRHHVHHYRGMTKNRLAAFQESSELKPLLYAFRAALTGIHLMRTGICQPHLLTIADQYRVGFVDELVERKRAGEHTTMQVTEAERWVREIDALLRRLEQEYERSMLPNEPSESVALDDFLVAVRTR